MLEESIARMRSSSDAPLHSSVDVVHVTKGQGQGRFSLVITHNIDSTQHLLHTLRCRVACKI